MEKAAKGGEPEAMFLLANWHRNAAKAYEKVDEENYKSNAQKSGEYFLEAARRGYKPAMQILTTDVINHWKALLRDESFFPNQSEESRSQNISFWSDQLKK